MPLEHTMSDTSQAILLGVFTLSSSVWVGGYVAIAVVARVATRILDLGQRVAFFRVLGRSYGVLGSAALLVALSTGASLLRGRPWDGTLTASTLLAAALVLALAVGVGQARRMTGLRRGALADPADSELAGRVRRGARSAALLRAAIGLLTLALIALGALLAT
jgi:uncharacterized membrane protein